jgi:hypothetical protein
MWHAVVAFVVGLGVAAWVVVDFHGFVDGPRPVASWAILLAWPFAMPFFVVQFIRARRELRGEGSS